MVGKAANNFSLLRLVFASLVILSHAPELKDGNRSRELFSRFTDMSFGELGVLGFFLISGYLIIKSYQSAGSVAGYTRNRVLRIYPAYVACFIVCVFLVAPLAGGSLSYLLGLGALNELGRMVLLKPPSVPGSFSALHYQELNGALWTIAYEFRCYLLVIVLGYCALLHKRIYAVISLAAVILTFVPIPDIFLVPVFGKPVFTARFTAAFLMGGSFYIYRDEIPLRGDVALAAFVALLLTLSLVGPYTYIPVLTLGAYVLFYIALKWPGTRLSELTAETDVSYGLYLWAWPIQSLIYLYAPSVDAWLGAALTFMASLLCGTVSWHLLEKRMLRLKDGPVPGTSFRAGILVKG
jgi:peptidoglycan/LPS O-acetylase OafA/YrhL